MLDTNVHRMTPVFIGGCDRSGTTLLGALLGSHTACLTVPESQFLIHVFHSYAGNIGEFDSQVALNLIREHWRFMIWDLDIPLGAIEQVQGKSYPELIEWIVAQYGMKTGKYPARGWIDHTPINVQYISTLLEMFPQARFIHIIRDGRAVASSIMRLHWPLSEIDKIAHFWLERLSYGFAAETNFGPKQIMRVRYEDIILETEKWLKKLCTFLELDFQPQMVQGGGFKPPAYTLRQHVLVGKAPEKQRINAWEKHLSPRQVEIFESITGDMLRYLGYVPMYSQRQQNQTRGERIVSGIRHVVIGEIINRLRWRYHRCRYISKTRITTR